MLFLLVMSGWASTNTTLEAELKIVQKRIKTFTTFEMPYTLDVQVLYERQKPKGFSDELKEFAI